MSIVLELQREASDSSVSVTDILRKALIVARKLGLREFQGWIESELNGYSEPREIPDYRVLHGQLEAWNHMQGRWMPCLEQNGVMEQNVEQNGVRPLFFTIGRHLPADLRECIAQLSVAFHLLAGTGSSPRSPPNNLCSRIVFLSVACERWPASRFLGWECDSVRLRTVSSAVCSCDYATRKLQ
jgi:hypothetical protein